jgi:AcrR family transcriptional regulator
MLVQFFGSEEGNVPTTDHGELTAPGQTAAGHEAGSGPTQRSRAKESRRQALLSAAATLFAVNGFNRVSLEDLGAAAGVSGPAVYRHFPGKQAVLGALLLTVSQDLLDGGRHVVADAADPSAALARLVQFHVDFALSNPDVIRVQDRDFSNLTSEDQAQVRALQRSYVEVWVDVLAGIHGTTDTADLRMRAHRDVRPDQLHAALCPQPRPADGHQVGAAAPGEHGPGGPAGHREPAGRLSLYTE